MRRDQVREITLFFLLGLMDEPVAMSAAQKSVARLKSAFPQATDTVGAPAIPPEKVVEVCRQIWKTHRRLVPRNQPPDVSQSILKVPASLDLKVWTRYQKDAPDEDMMTVLFSFVFGLTDQELADGFQTSIGTIRYRLGKAVRQLGLAVRATASGGPR